MPEPLWSEQRILNAAYDETTNSLKFSGGQADGATNTSNPMLVGAEAQDPTSLPTAATAGELVKLLADLSRRLITSMGTQIAGEDLSSDVLKTEGQFSYAIMSALGVNTVKSGAGHCRRIFVAGGTLASTTVYDNTAASGTLIVPTVTPTVNGVLIEDVNFGTGLTISAASATVMTIAYR